MALEILLELVEPPIHVRDDVPYVHEDAFGTAIQQRLDALACTGPHDLRLSGPSSLARGSDHRPVAPER